MIHLSAFVSNIILLFTKLIYKLDRGMKRYYSCVTCEQITYWKIIYGHFLPHTEQMFKAHYVEQEIFVGSPSENKIL